MNISDRTALLKNSLRAIFVTATLTLSAVSAAQEYTVNLKDTDIQEFIKFVADVTGTTMVVDPKVKGKVKGACPDAPLLVGSGARASNARDLLEYADGLIVASSLKLDGILSNPVDVDRVRELRAIMD